MGLELREGGMVCNVERAHGDGNAGHCIRLQDYLAAFRQQQQQQLTRKHTGLFQTVGNIARTM